MEVYADIAFYKEVHRGKFGGEDAELLGLLEAASRKVDELTLRRVGGKGFDNLTPYQKECVKFAVCFQADYIDERGEGDERDVARYSAAGVSVTFDGRGPADKARFSPAGYSLLEGSGLMYRGI